MKKTKQLRLTLGNLPEAAAAGKEAAVIKPVEKLTVDLFRPYMAVKKEKLAQQFEGLFFDENGISATNQKLFLHVEMSTPRRGIYYPNGKPIDGRIPDYGTLIKEMLKRNTVTAEVDTAVFDDYLSQVVAKMSNDARENEMFFVAPDDRVISYNARFMQTIVKTLLSQGVKKADFRFRSDESIERQPFLIQTHFPMGKAYLLLMPCSFTEPSAQVLQKGIAFYSQDPETGFQTLPERGLYYLEKNAVVMPTPIDRDRKKKLMAMKAKALTLKLKLLTL